MRLPSRLHNLFNGQCRRRRSLEKMATPRLEAQSQNMHFRNMFELCRSSTSIRVEACRVSRDWVLELTHSCILRQLANLPAVRSKS
mmetsp:Transcript_115595/g.313886  ORF Transcript_115595/g.313886 Transcript_115595/m.313886 type:complete len:86 (+) Transcript_115595:226-483(+)